MPSGKSRALLHYPIAIAYLWYRTRVYWACLLGAPTRIRETPTLRDTCVTQWYVRQRKR